MDEFEIDLNDDLDPTTNTNSRLPDITKEARNMDREKASNLFNAMSNAIEQEQAKQGSSNLNAIDRHWQSRPMMKSKEAQQQDDQSSDSFELDDNTAFAAVNSGVKLSNDLPVKAKEESGSDEDEFGIVDHTQKHNFKKLDKSNLLAYSNDPSLSQADRDEYKKSLDQLKEKKKDLKQNNNIKGAVIVEDEDEESSEDEDEVNPNLQGKGKIGAIIDGTIGEYNKQQKEIQKMQKVKEASALAKLDIMKAERAKNKIISSAGKGLVTNNLSSKLKSLAQNREYDANKLLAEENKAPNVALNSAVAPQANPDNLAIKRRKIFIKGRQIGVVDFQKAALKCVLKVENVYMNKQIINITDIKSEESKIATKPMTVISPVINNTNQNLNSDSSPAVKPVKAAMGEFHNDMDGGDNEVMNKWMQINKAREEEIEQKLNKNYDEVDDNPVQVIGYMDVWMYFLTEDYKDVIDDIVRESGSSGGLMSVFSAKSKLDKSLQNERDIFMCLAKVKLDTSIEIHERILNSIYMNLTGETSCARTGPHWIEVGFQNEDPYTDIRGSGILGLIQLLYFVEKYNDLACRYVTHSQLIEYKFPFIIKCFEFTTLSLKILRTGKLYKECNKKGSVDGVCNEVYSAAIWLFMSKYIQQQSNIRHMNDLNNQVFEYVENNPTSAVQKFRDFLESQRDDGHNDDNDHDDFAQYNLERSNEKSQEEDGHNYEQDMGRVNKYAM